METSKNKDMGWHLDRRVPLALIITILLQTSGFIWFMAQLDSRVSFLEKTQVENEKVNRVVYELGPTIQAIQSSQARMERSQEKLEDRLNRKDD